MRRWRCGVIGPMTYMDVRSTVGTGASNALPTSCMVLVARTMPLLCRTQVVRLGQGTCLTCGQRHWCGRGDALHTWEYNAAPAAGSNLPTITVGGLGHERDMGLVTLP